MAADTVAAPRLSLNVKYNRNIVEENSGEEEENQLKILEEEEHYGDLGSQRARPRNPAAGNRRCFRATAVTLGGFYLLVMAGLFIHFTLLQTRYETLQTRYDQLSSNYSQIQRKVSDVSVKISQLQSSCETLSVNHSQLQDEVKQLETRIKEKLCPDRWKRSGYSFYFKSEKRNYWFGSRDDCEQRGADLVVINNEEEQKFVTELSKDGEYWIGLRYRRRQGEYKWEWVDGSPLTETFWSSGLPREDGNFTAATCCDQQGKWRQRSDVR
ncbi:C-type lectin domain family 4 member A-like isoform X2 [Sander lucioperca]|uniref:C-type lectin domain family 4 member A-like isoform X2 n=1 Tax=Sander lucioperca TaxID=283035 RepID=UPI001653AB5B|nr:C-type lectin domain family 4 member A-like isoform X2 [Sander lucioperca]